ncbi:hypothetical protein ACFL20_02950 [Spirochaetota bacterium]
MNESKLNLKSTIYLLAVFIASFLFFYFMQNMESLADPDSYYHAKMARLMIEKGFIFKKFPAMSFTILKDNYVDYHWLYHASLIPFVSIFGDLMGVRIATIFLTSLFLTIFYFILQRNNIKHPVLFLLLLTTVPTFTLRLSIVKANAASLCFLFLGINLILKDRRRWLFFLSMVYVWFYGGFILLAGASLIYIISLGIKNMLDNSAEILKAKVIYGRAVKYFFKGTLFPRGWKAFLAVLGGNLTGMLINPYAFSNFKFYWVQIYKIAMAGSPGGFDLGRGWYSISGLSLLNETVVLIIVLIILIALLLILKVKVNFEFVFFATLTIAFIILTKRSIRMFEYSTPLSAWFLAVGFKLLVQSISGEQLINTFDKLPNTKIPLKGISFVLATAAIYISFFLVINRITSVKKMLYNHPLQHLSGPAKWLKKNTSKGSIVFNAGWDDWPFLFYFNNHNNYLVGLDPIFMYEYDTHKYKLWFKIINGGVKENLARTIIKNFNSNYIVFSKKIKFSRFMKNLKDSKKVTMVFKDISGFVYKLE